MTESELGRKPICNFVSRLVISYLMGGLSVPWPSSQWKKTPVLAVLDCAFTIAAATLHV